jgi:hypothetical protein
MLNRFLQNKKNPVSLPRPYETNLNPTEYKEATVLFPDITADILLEWCQFPFQGVGKIACQNAINFQSNHELLKLQESNRGGRGEGAGGCGGGGLGGRKTVRQKEGQDIVGI